MLYVYVYVCVVGGGDFLQVMVVVVVGWEGRQRGDRYHAAARSQVAPDPYRPVGCRLGWRLVLAPSCFAPLRLPLEQI